MNVDMKGGSTEDILLNLQIQNKKFAESLKGAKPIYEMTPKEARQVLLDLQKDSVNKLMANIQDIDTIFEDKSISIRIVRSINSINTKLPVTIYIHGGGWILGDKLTHDHLIKDLAIQSNSAIIFVNYTPSPEGPFPTAIEESYRAIEYILSNGDKHNLDTSKIAIAGDSVGGNMAIAVTLLIIQRQKIKLLYLVLFYPVTSAAMDTESYKIYAEGPWLTRKAMEWFWNAYEPDMNKRDNFLISPLNTPIELLQNFPPTLLITDENDVLRDEGENFARKLMRAGVDVTTIRYIGTIHDFVMLSPLIDTPASKSAISLAASNLKKNFQ